MFLKPLSQEKPRHSGMDDRQGWRKCGRQVGTCAACRNPEARDGERNTSMCSGYRQSLPIRRPYFYDFAYLLKSVKWYYLLLFPLLLIGCAADNPRYQDNANLERPPEIPIDKQAAEQIAANEIEKPIRRHGKGLKSDIYRVESSTTELKIKRSFDETWSLLHQAIQHNDLKVTDQDRSKGNYYIAYNGGSFFSGASSFFGDERKQPTYLLKVEPQGEETGLTVSLAGKDEQNSPKGKDSPVDSPEDKSSKLLELLYDTLHDSVKDE